MTRYVQYYALHVTALWGIHSVKGLGVDMSDPSPIGTAPTALSEKGLEA